MRGKEIELKIFQKDFLKAEHTNKNSYREDKESLFAINNEDDGWSQDRKEKLINYGNPDCYDWDKFIVKFNKRNLIQDVLTKLKNDEIATMTITPFKKKDEKEKTANVIEVEINPKSTSIIFVEGIFLYKYEKLRDLFDFKIFVEVDEDIRLSRMGKNIKIKYIQSCMRIPT